MIVGFEEQTYELTPQEENVILPFVKERLKAAKGKVNSVTSGEIIALLQQEHAIKIYPARFRKIVNYIRIKKVIPNLLSTSTGYFVSNDQKEIDRYVKSLTQRINSISLVRDSLIN